MYRYLHFCCIAVLIFLTILSWRIPRKIYGAPEWYSQNCWFSNWKSPVWQVDCATNLPVSNYYSGKNAIGMRDPDRMTLLSMIKQRGCVTAGVDYYAFTSSSRSYFPKVFDRYFDYLAEGNVLYMKICLKDTMFTYELIGSSREKITN